MSFYKFAKSVKPVLVQEGGSGGHIAHPFELDYVNNGSDLIKCIKSIAARLDIKTPAVKFDGANLSFKYLPDLNQFGLDRGSSKPLDIEGVTLDKLNDRFGEGHGIIESAKLFLEILNNTTSKLLPYVKKLGLDKPNIFMNAEFINDGGNAISYDSSYIVLHNVGIFKQVTPRRRDKTQVAVNQSDIDKFAETLNEVAKNYDIKVLSKVPAYYKKKPNFDKVLNQIIKLDFNGVIKTSKLGDEVSRYDNPRSERVVLNGMKIGALSHKVYIHFLDGGDFNDFDKPELAVAGALFYHTTRVMGQEVLDSLTSDVGDLKQHEGVVINDPYIHSDQVKLTGDFIINRTSGKFFKVKESIKPLKNNGKQLNENNDQYTIGLIGGSFKPPHKGHIEMIKQVANISDRCIVIISDPTKERSIRRLSNNKKITGEEASKLMNILLNAEGIDARVVVANNPIKWIMDFVINSVDNDQDQHIAVGVSSKGNDGVRYTSINNLVPPESKTTVSVITVDPVGNISATDFREAIASGNDIKPFLPNMDDAHYNKFMSCINSITESVELNTFETIVVDGEEFEAKIDTGNDGYNVMHGSDVSFNGNKITFTTSNGNKITKDVVEKVNIHTGSGNKEMRAVVSFDTMVIEGLTFNNVKFSIADRSENETPVLISNQFLIDIDATIRPTDE